MKRKTDETGSNANGLPESKKRALSTEEAVSRFRDGLFDTAEQQKYTDEYAKSNPYVFFLPLKASMSLLLTCCDFLLFQLLPWSHSFVN